MTPPERETGTQILEAAATLFAERGFKSTTTRAIADAAGVNEVTIFRRFGSKKGVLEALARSWAESMAGYAVGHLPDPADTRATLEALARLEVAQARHYGAAAMRLALDAKAVPEVAKVMEGGPADNFSGLVEYLRERQDAGDLRRDVAAEVMTEMFFATTSSMIMGRQLMGDGSAPYDMPLDETVAQVIEVLWSGIAAR